MMRTAFALARRLWPVFLPCLALAAAPAPNVVLIFADDLGYGDLRCYGSKIPTPSLDRMAAEGVRFTQFYAAQAVCSASRAALMTGCYPNRVGILGALGPKAKIGLNPNETTLAELLKERGYATAIYGKWHLGDAPQFLPVEHGFDHYFGLPYSNDMWPHHPTGGRDYPPLPLMEGTNVSQLMPDQTQLTTWYAERAVGFIKRNANRPFFLYLPHSMPHVPLHVSAKFKGKSGAGLYGDVIMELDWAVGQVLDAIRDHGLEQRTLVIFTSDNGPWLLYGNHAGSSGGLREGKGTSFEGGVRVPCIMRWPGVIPAGRTCDGMAATMDILPTIARLAGAEAPRMIDGHDLWPLVSGSPGAVSPRSTFFYYWGQHLQAVRSGRWKLHFAHPFTQPKPAGQAGQPGAYTTRRIGQELFDLEQDPGETANVAEQHPEVVRELERTAGQVREDLGDSATGQKGRHTRAPGRVPAA